MNELLEQIRKDLASVTLPLCEGYMYTAIRHCVRNEDFGDVHFVSEDTPPSGSTSCLKGTCNGPEKYDGEAIARIVNSLPALFVEIERLQAQITNLAYERIIATRAYGGGPKDSL